MSQDDTARGIAWNKCSRTSFEEHSTKFVVNRSSLETQEEFISPESVISVVLLPLPLQSLQRCIVRTELWTLGTLATYHYATSQAQLPLLARPARPASSSQTLSKALRKDVRMLILWMEAWHLQAHLPSSHMMRYRAARWKHTF
jgi:hypothetical protein